MNGRQAVPYGEPRSLALGRERGPLLQERRRLPEDSGPGGANLGRVRLLRILFAMAITSLTKQGPGSASISYLSLG